MLHQLLSDLFWSNSETCAIGLPFTFSWLREQLSLSHSISLSLSLFLILSRAQTVSRSTQPPPLTQTGIHAQSFFLNLSHTHFFFTLRALTRTLLNFRWCANTNTQLHTHTLSLSRPLSRSPCVSRYVWHQVKSLLPAKPAKAEKVKGTVGKKSESSIMEVESKKLRGELFGATCDNPSSNK